MIDKIYEVAGKEGLSVEKFADNIVAVGFKEEDDCFNNDYDLEMSNRLDKVVDEIVFTLNVKELLSVEHPEKVGSIDVFALFKL